MAVLLNALQIAGFSRLRDGRLTGWLTITLDGSYEREANSIELTVQWMRPSSESSISGRSIPRRSLDRR